MSETKLDEFTQGYIECALWASTDEYCEECAKPCAIGEPCECGAGKGVSEPMDANYSVDDIAPETLAKMTEECVSFQTANATLLEQWGEHGRDLDHSGHDFWLTRNHHGAGFWDRFSGGHPAAVIGRLLTDAAHTYGSFDLYVGEDELIHGE